MAPKLKTARKPKARAPDYTPRPPNAWILYRSAQLKVLKQDTNLANKPQAEISKLIGYMWRDEAPATRKKYEAQAARAKVEHSQKYPNYSFNPQRKSKSAAQSPQSSVSPPASPQTPSVHLSPAAVAESSLFGFSSQPALDCLPAEAYAPWPTPPMAAYDLPASESFDSIYAQMPLSAPAVTSSFGFGMESLAAPELLCEPLFNYYPQQHYEPYTPPYTSTYDHFDAHDAGLAFEPLPCSALDSQTAAWRQTQTPQFMHEPIWAPYTH